MDSITNANHSSSKTTSAISRWIAGFTKCSAFLSGLASIVAAAAPDWWVGDLCANLRIQWTFALGTALLILVTTRHWKWSVVCLCFAASNTLVIANALDTFSNEVAQVSADAPTCVTVCTFNVLTTNRNYESIQKQLFDSNADIVVIPELSSGLKRYLTGAFAEEYQWSRVDSRDGGNFGIGLYSRLPIQSARIFTLNSSIPSVEAFLQIDGQQYYVVATHTFPPMGRDGFRRRNRHLELLANRLRKIATESPDTTLIVAGDLNLTPWSPLFSEFCKQAGLLRTGAGIQPTWYRFPAFPFGLVLDHVLASADMQCVRYSVGEAAGSDHRCVTAKFARIK